MEKRRFRSVPPAPREDTPSYPTLDEFDRASRRGFLARLGAALVGAGGLAVLGACGERRVGGGPDLGPTMGKQVPPDARVDVRGDGGSLDPDVGPEGGVARPLDARADRLPPPEPDAHILAGDAPGPDARVDEQVPDPSPGFAPVMDARVDEEPTMGKRTPPGARIDGGSCKP